MWDSILRSLYNHTVRKIYFDWELFETGIRVGDDSDVKGVTPEQLAQRLRNEHLSPEHERSLRRGKKQGIIIAVARVSHDRTYQVPHSG